MKKEDLILLILGLLLLAGMVLTILFGGEKSMHGVGSLERRDLEGRCAAPGPNRACVAVTLS